MDDTGTRSSLPCVLRGERFAAESVGADAGRSPLSCKQPIDDVWLGAGLVFLEERSSGRAERLFWRKHTGRAESSSLQFYADVAAGGCALHCGHHETKQAS